MPLRSSVSLEPGFNDVWLIMFVILGTLVLWSTIVQQTAFGQIYQILFVFTLMLYLISKVTPDFSEFVNLNHRALVLQIMVGFLLGFALVGALYGTYALLSPLSVPDIKFTSPLGILGFEAISQVFLMSVVVSELEESFRSSALRPTISEWAQNKIARTVFFLVTSLVIYMVIQPIRIVGAVLFVIAVADGLGFINISERIFKSQVARQALGVTFAAFLFAVLHLRAYGGTAGVEYNMVIALLANAFLFAVIAEVINIKFNATTPSKVAHCMNNASISAVSIGLPAIVGFFITAVYAIVLFIMSRGQREDLMPNNILKSLGDI